MKHPPRPSSLILGILLALLVHAILFIFLFLGVSWKTHAPEPIAVELWAALPPRPTPPSAQAQSNAPSLTLPTEADIAIDSAESTDETESSLTPSDNNANEPNTSAHPNSASDPAPAEPIDKEQQLKEAMRAAVDELNSTEDSLIPGQDQRNQTAGGGGDDAYAAKIRACIEPNVSFPANAPGNPSVEFKVFLRNNGQQSKAPAMVRSSGIEGFDRAVDVGIRKCNPFPKPTRGDFPSSLNIQYNLYN